MCSSDIIVIDDAIHVGRDNNGHWWAVGDEGSFGGSCSRDTAIEVALAATATAYHGHRRIIVHRPGGAIDFVITRTYQRPSPQHEQDTVA